MGRKLWNDDKLLERLLNNKSERTYWDIISELRRRPSKQLFEKCLQLAGCENPKARKIAIDILSQLGITPRPYYKKSVALFFSILKKEKDEEVIHSLLYAIGHNNENLSDNQVKNICLFRNSEVLKIKQAVTFALGGVDNPKAIETLIILSSDKSASIRDTATFAIGSLSEIDSQTIREALWNRTKDNNEDTKFEAIAGLAKRKDKKIGIVIENELNTEKYQGLLFEAIINFENRKFLPVLEKQYEKLKHDTDINPDWLEQMEACIHKLKLL